MMQSPVSTNLPKRFWDKVTPAMFNGCWLWTASLRKGYGRFWMNGKYRTSHILSYRDAGYPIPVGAELDHTCTNKNCVNPAHLFPVTHQENIIRASRRAR